MAKTKILIVEDESRVAKDIEKMLKRMRCGIAGVVTSGEKAVIKATELLPDLILMDIGLRGYMDGIEAAEKISIHKTIKSKFKIPDTCSSPM